jgi:hypothetical protein
VSHKAPEVSPVVREMMDLYMETMAALDRGEDRAQCHAQLEAGLRVIYTVADDRDPRLWKRCYVCQDTGYEIIERHPSIYGGEVAVRVARPCVCELGQKRSHALMAYDEQRRSSHAGPKKAGGWRKA